MSYDDPLALEASIDLREWDRDSQRLLRDLRQIERQMDDVVQASTRMDAALRGGGALNFSLDVDTAELDTVEALRTDLEAPVVFDIQAEFGSLLAAEADHFIPCGGDLVAFLLKDALVVEDADLDTAKRKRDDLDENTSFRADVQDGDLDTANRKREDLEAPVSTRVNVDTSDLDDAATTAEGIRDTLTSITVGGAVAGADRGRGYRPRWTGGAGRGTRRDTDADHR